MKTKIIVFIIIIIVVTILYNVLFSQRYNDDDRIILTDFTKDYEISEVYDSQTFTIEDINLDLEFRGLDKYSTEFRNFVLIFGKYAHGSLVLGNNGNISIFIVPSSKRYEIIYLEEFSFPSPEVVLAELDELQELTTYDIVYISAQQNSFITDPYLQVIDIQDELGDDFQLATLYLLRVAAINDRASELFLAMGANETYAFVEYSYIDETFSLYHIFE